MPEWPPYPDGEKPLLIDITGQEANEGDLYDVQTGVITPNPGPSQETLNAMRREEILIRFNELDLKSIRSIGSIQAGVGTDADTTRLRDIEDEKVKLRSEFSSLLPDIELRARTRAQPVVEPDPETESEPTPKPRVRAGARRVEQPVEVK